MRLIDADALNTAIKTYANNIAYYGRIEYASGVENAVCVVHSAPTVDAVEVVRAMWHDVYLITPWIATGICSHCNLKSYINPDFPFAKYCPNCGAKMDGGADSETD